MSSDLLIVPPLEFRHGTQATPRLFRRLLSCHHNGLALGRTSCSQFWANQFRGLLTAAAYVLLQELRRRAQGTACAHAQVSTLRERLLKLAVWVERSVRRVVLHLPQYSPWGDTWRRVAMAVGATTG